jgi:hypothetical protein
MALKYPQAFVESVLTRRQEELEQQPAAARAPAMVSVMLTVWP